MNESNLTRLKINVEGAVRPVRASTGRKFKMREELLAHLCGVFEEESAKNVEDRIALERTSLRFGNPAEITSQLQESVTAIDGILRRLEAHPEESMLRGALRFAWIEAAISCLALGAAVFAAGYTSAWSGEELMAMASSFGFLPFWLFMPFWLVGIAFIAHWLEPSLQGDAPLTGWPRVSLIRMWASGWAARPVRIAMSVGGFCLLVLAGTGGFRWPLHRADWDSTSTLGLCLLITVLASCSVLVAWMLVQTVAERRRRTSNGRDCSWGNRGGRTHELWPAPRRSRKTTIEGLPTGVMSRERQTAGLRLTRKTAMLSRAGCSSKESS